LTRGAEPIELTGGELSLQQVLIVHADRPVSRDRLLQLTRGPDSDATERSIDVQILRQ
jgi:two-component system phosphate regulon response regulator OmpR